MYLKQKINENPINNHPELVFAHPGLVQARHEVRREHPGLVGVSLDL